MNRKDAINELAKFQVKLLNKAKREEYLSEWWYIDEDDDEFHRLPTSLKHEMEENEEFGNPEDKKYEPLILQALIYKFKGVRNEYIERELYQFTNEKKEVKGKLEELEKCPCCEYKTLEKRGEWYICVVCYWEDDLTEDLDVRSGPNRMSLREAKANFLKIGACEESLVEYTEKEAELKYEK